MTGLRSDIPGKAQIDDVYIHIGQRLRELRVGKGMTQAQAGTLIGVSPQQYQKYEEAQTKCSITNLMILADHYGTSVTALLPAEVDRIENRLPSEADMLARLVAAYTQLDTPLEKLRLIQLLETMVQTRAGGPE